MAHFTLTSPFRAHRTRTYGSLAVLDLRAHCTHLQNPYPNSMKDMIV